MFDAEIWDTPLFFRHQSQGFSPAVMSDLDSSWQTEVSGSSCHNNIWKSSPVKSFLHYLREPIGSFGSLPGLFEHPRRLWVPARPTPAAPPLLLCHSHLGMMSICSALFSGPHMRGPAKASPTSVLLDGLSNTLLSSQPLTQRRKFKTHKPPHLCLLLWLFSSPLHFSGGQKGWASLL